MEKEPFLAHPYLQITNPNSQLPPKSAEKIFDTLKLLYVHKIHRDTFENQCFQGIPEECNGLRSLCYKLLLNYIPEWPSKWKESLEASRKQYENYIDIHVLPRLNKINAEKNDIKQPVFRASRSQSEATSKPQTEENKTSDNLSSSLPKGRGFKSAFSNNDHPLSTENDSKYNTHFKDNKLMEDIVKDAKRTRSTTEFFKLYTDYPLQKIYGTETVENYQKETHIDVLSRILFVYGKLNPSIGYMQGMNEVLAPIYYCFYNDLNPIFVGRAEADAYHCFASLMKQIQDGFKKKLVNAEEGIQTRVKALNELLKRVDKQLWSHLEKHKVNPQFYSLKWLMLLLAQEFSIDDTLKVWDRLFAHPKKVEFLNYLCLAIIQDVRESLIKADDFATIMETLQKSIGSDLEKIFATGFRLYKQFAKPEDIVQHITLL